VVWGQKSPEAKRNVIHDWLITYTLQHVQQPSKGSLTHCFIAHNRDSDYTLLT